MASNPMFRWAFNLASWCPSAAEIMLCSSCIQPEEKIRLLKFVFKEDLKASMIGRLMMRKFISSCTDLPYSEIKLSRDKNGKPFLNYPVAFDIDFNVSHQGNFVVLGGHIGQGKIGIDIMNITPPINKDIPEFFRLMKRQFSPCEWGNIKKNDLQQKQLASFYRHWCLKESYVKNIGVGITIDLQSISFDIKDSLLNIGKFTTSTDLNVSNVPITGWIFEETMLDDAHIVAVALNLNGEDYQEPNSYTIFNFEDLMYDAIPFLEKDQQFTSEFFNKEEKKF